jgi:phage terminase large subunit GpA-like protein
MIKDKGVKITKCVSDITIEHLQSVAKKLVEACHIELSNLLPSEFAEKYLSLSQAVSPARHGRFSYNYTPYWREVVDFFSPTNQNHTGAVMKPSQIGGTQSVIIPAILWIIGQQGGTSMFLTGDEGLARKFVNSRLEQAINSAGLRNLIKVQEQRGNKSKSGDTELEKQFPNGILNCLGAQNLDRDMVMDTVQYLLADEVDRWKSTYKQGGDAFSLTESRGLTLGNRRRYM